MTTRTPLLAAAAVIALGPLAAWSQTTTLRQVPLKTLWQMPLGNDLTSSTDPQERSAHLPAPALFYLPALTTYVNGTAITGLAPLNRLLKAGDHMDSNASSAAGYTLEGTIGYAWKQADAAQGLSALTRVLGRQAGTPQLGDHATVVLAAPVPHSDLPANYSVDSPLGYAYSRMPGSDRQFIGSAGGGVLARSNVATGGALWEWWWNGTQFINDYDYGRQIQSSVVFGPTPYSLTEAGDEWSNADVDASLADIDLRHPSPTAFAAASGTSQSTLSVPLEFFPERFSNGGKTTPIIYPDATIGKDLALDWIGPDNVRRNWPVALYTTHVNLPSSVAVAAVEAPTGYLTAAFNTFYKLDLTSGVLTLVSCPQKQTCNVTSGGKQAIIVATSSASTATAMGVYINDPNAGFIVVDNTSGSNAGQYGPAFAKWGVNYYANLYPGWTFRTWIATDTLQNVKADLLQLATWGVVSRDLPPTAATASKNSRASASK